MRPQKGMFLSTLIVIFGLAVSIASILLIFNQGIRHALGNLPGWFNPFVAVLLVGRWIGLAAIWRLKRWGVVVVLVFECVEVSFGLFVFTGFLTFPLRVVIAVPTFIALLVIWFLALRPNWQLFS